MSSLARSRMQRVLCHVAPKSLSSSSPVRTFVTSANARGSVWILSGVRTPIGTFQGSLSGASAVQLGTTAVKEAITRAGVSNNDVNELIFGNVISANLGQAAVTQLALKAGLPPISATAVNKVCSSGMKALMFGANSIQAGLNKCVVVGGMESMTNAPFYINARSNGLGLGHGSLIDANIRDGLWDANDNHHMGSCAEHCAATFKITREQQDKYAIESFRRAQAAAAAGRFKDEIVSVSITDKKGATAVVDSDDGIHKLKLDKMATLKPVFKKEGGTVTAANASSLNDGAAAMVIADGEWAAARGLKPMAILRGMGDAQRIPIEFTIAPALAIPRALENAGITKEQVDAFEINEAFAVVAVANEQLLKLDSSKLNVNGGAIALGHPIGASGARIIVTLMNVLKQKNGRYGVAGICNGGGGASAIVIERPI